MDTRSIQRQLQEIESDEVTAKVFLDAGSGGDVYRAKWQGRTIAIKEMFCFDNFNSEKRMHEQLARLKVPHVVYCYGVHSSSNSIIMEYMGQGSLEKLLMTKKPFAWERRYQVALHVAEAVGFLHENALLHRDVKTANVLLNKNFEAKLCDFDLALSVKESKDDFVAGTDGWHAPELKENNWGGHNTKATDVYSMGLVVWSVFTRKIPVETDTNRSKEIAAMEKAERKADGFDGFFTGVAAVVKGALVKNPAKRFSAKKVTQRLIRLDGR